MSLPHRSSTQRSCQRDYTPPPNNFCTPLVPQEEDKALEEGHTDVPSLRLTLASKEAEIECQVKGC